MIRALAAASLVVVCASLSSLSLLVSASRCRVPLCGLCCGRRIARFAARTASPPLEWCPSLCSFHAPTRAHRVVPHTRWMRECDSGAASAGQRFAARRCARFCRRTLTRGRATCETTGRVELALTRSAVIRGWRQDDSTRSPTASVHLPLLPCPARARCFHPPSCSVSQSGTLCHSAWSPQVPLPPSCCSCG